MPSTVTVTKPTHVTVVHARPTSGNYHRFDTSVTAVGLQDNVKDNTSFSGVSVTFSAGSGTITPTFPAGITQLHVILDTGHYYRFESSGQVTNVQNGDTTGLFSTISFATS
jgi:hypothetical protein